MRIFTPNDVTVRASVGRPPLPGGTPLVGDPMRPLHLLLALTGSLLLGTGCHAKFKKAAPTLGQVDAQVIINSGPSVYLGRMDSGDSLVANIVDLAVNVSQAINEVEVADRIVNAVDVNRTNESMERGFAKTLGDGPPFAYVLDGAPATVQMELVDWGMIAPFIGAQAQFDYTIRVRIYKADGERVYSARTQCSTSAGAPPAVSRALGLVSNIKQIEMMSDEEIQGAFDAVGEWCGQEIVRKMRKHAG